MAVKSHIEIAPGLKVAAQMSPEPSDEEMAFVRQMGVEYAVTWVDSAKASPEYYRSRREHFARGGIQLYGLGNGSVHNVDAITLNLPNRDEKVEEYKAHIRNLGQADIPYTTYAHMANSVWSTPPEQTRGGSRARAFDMARLAEASGGGFTGEGLTHGRDYTEEELWDNFASFAVEIAPVAEEAGVRIGIHPDDPPGVPLGGVPRPIFSSFEGYKRALEIADSPNVGMCLCIGCWLEGGGGDDPLLRRAGQNIQSPLPQR
ncbi:MAG: mannonate dehydratase [Candidatus Latescibacteria bacterium]|nr:mannonate dehydratase [Candidatus Latescibacterota bacterium]